MTELSEDRLQADCYLWYCENFPDERDFLWMQYNTPKNAVQGAKLKAMGMRAGVSDLAYLHPCGRMYFIELKTRSGVQSKKQKDWEQSVTARDARYFLVRNLEEFKKIFADLLNY